MVQMLWEVVRVVVARGSAVGGVSQIVLAHLFAVLQQHVDTVVVTEELSHLSGKGFGLILVLVEPMA